MYLEDVLEPSFGLQQDEWSLQQHTFGNENQLKIIGWSGKVENGYNKIYIVRCSACSKDEELYGTGHFKTTKNSVLRLNSIPCGCAASGVRWSAEQYSVLCERKAKNTDYGFIGFCGEFKGNTTKIRLSCKKHGIWETNTINKFLSQGRGCPRCKGTPGCNKKPDEDMIRRFRSTGMFHSETVFTRNLVRLNNKGRKSYWDVYCPECDCTSSALSGCLNAGKRPCECSPSRQKECYLHVVLFDSEAIAVKFGIAVMSSRRLKEQISRNTGLEFDQIGVYLFDSNDQCKNAERLCKQVLECGILSKERMPDGWSETTLPSNIGKIINIYESHGGIRIK